MGHRRGQRRLQRGREAGRRDLAHGGVRDEAETECRSLQTIAFTAQRLGASEPQGRALARGQYLEAYPQMGEAYRSGTCVDGRHGDLHPQDARFP